MANFKAFSPTAWRAFTEQFPKDSALVCDTLPTATEAGIVRFQRSDSKWYVSETDDDSFKWTAMASGGDTPEVFVQTSYTTLSYASLAALGATSNVFVVLQPGPSSVPMSGHNAKGITWVFYDPDNDRYTLLEEQIQKSSGTYSTYAVKTVITSAESVSRQMVRTQGSIPVFATTANLTTQNISVALFVQEDATNSSFTYDGKTWTRANQTMVWRLENSSNSLQYYYSSPVMLRSGNDNAVAILALICNTTTSTWTTEIRTLYKIPTVDSALDDTSSNPVQNQVITEEFAKTFQKPTTQVTTGSADDLTEPGVYALSQAVTCKGLTEVEGGYPRILVVYRTLNSETQYTIIQTLYSFTGTFRRAAYPNTLTSASFVEFSTNNNSYAFLKGPTWWFDSDSPDILQALRNLSPGDSLQGILDDPVTSTSIDSSWYMVCRGDSDTDITGIASCDGTLYKVTVSAGIFNLTDEQLEDATYCQQWINNSSNVWFEALEGRKQIAPATTTRTLSSTTSSSVPAGYYKYSGSFTDVSSGNFTFSLNNAPGYPSLQMKYYVEGPVNIASMQYISWQIAFNYQDIISVLEELTGVTGITRDDLVASDDPWYMKLPTNFALFAPGSEGFVQSSQSTDIYIAATVPTFTGVSPTWGGYITVVKEAGMFNGGYTIEVVFNMTRLFRQKRLEF